MAGKLEFKYSFKKRLDLLQPSRADLQTFARDFPPQLSPRVGELIDKLHQRGTRVYLVSGGLRELIAPVAARLNIPDDRIMCNRLHFTDEGKYSGIDFTQPTTRSGGKAEVLKSLACEAPVMIGDGATDLEARASAAAFIGYGGNVVHKRVKEKADWYIRDFSELLAVLP
jgi:phosphoserine phosphatase